MRSEISSNESDFQREIHPACGTELVDQNLVPGMTFNVFEQDGRTAWGYSCEFRMVCVRTPCFGDPVGDFSNFQNRIDFSTHAPQFSGTLQRLDPLAKIAIRQTCPPGAIPAVTSELREQTLNYRG